MMNVMRCSTATIIYTLLMVPVVCEQTEAAKLMRTSSPISFLKAMCAKTTYPRVCVASLSPYASTVGNSKVELTRAAVSVSLDTARSTLVLVTSLYSNGVLTPSESIAVRDCVPTMGDCVAVLQKSLDTMVALRDQRQLAAGDWMQMDDVKTWVSAALTDETTCAGGFAGGERTAARMLNRKVNDAMQCTSNALAFLNLIGPGST